MKKTIWIFLVSVIIILTRSSYASELEAKNQSEIGSTTKAEVIETLVNKLSENYIFPEKVNEFSHYISLKNTKKQLENIQANEDFEKQLNQILASTIDDQHLRVYYSEQPLPKLNNDVEFIKLMNKQEQAMMLAMNYGVNKIERLPFNIGYIDLSMFADVELVEDTIAATFGVVANTEALIIDLRYCRGGDPKTVAHIASYLLDNKTHLSDIYTRKDDVTERIESLTSVSGKRYGQQRPVYILMGKDSFSAAEDFAYTLKHLNRATVVGEVSGGGAHPGDFYRLSEHFEVFIPVSRTINPITQSNWEGVGVQPNIKVDAQLALSMAQVAILNSFKDGEQDSARKMRMEKRIESLQTKQ